MTRWTLRCIADSEKRRGQTRRPDTNRIRAQYKSRQERGSPRSFLWGLYCIAIPRHTRRVKPGERVGPLTIRTAKNNVTRELSPSPCVFIFHGCTHCRVLRDNRVPSVFVWHEGAMRLRGAQRVREFRKQFSRAEPHDERRRAWRMASPPAPQKNFANPDDPPRAALRPFS